jgi:exonuclease SbcD
MADRGNKSLFLHAADLHLGAPLQSLGTRVSEEVRADALLRSQKAFENLIDLAITEGVAFVVLSGDIYDRADRDPAARRRVLKGLRRLDESGIPVFIAHGNHDPLTASAMGAELPDNVVVFPSDELGVHEVLLPNGVTVTIAGISYSRSEETRRLVESFKLVNGQSIVGVLHTNVGGVSAHGNYAPSSVQELENSPVHYWALGHIHDRQVNPTTKGWWAYPGNLQGRSTKTTECGPKGVLLVAIDSDGRFEEPQFRPCDVMRFERCSVDLSAVTDDATIHDRVNDALDKLVDAADSRPVFVRLEFTGATPIASVLNSRWDAFSLEIIEESSEVLGPGAIVKIDRSYRPAIDLRVERERETLLGAVLRRLDSDAELTDNPKLREKIERTLAAALGGDR